MGIGQGGRSRGEPVQTDAGAKGYRNLPDAALPRLARSEPRQEACPGRTPRGSPAAPIMPVMPPEAAATAPRGIGWVYAQFR